MNSSRKNLAEHTTESDLIMSKKGIQMIILKVSENEINSQPFSGYLEVMIDTHLNLREQVGHVGTKASSVKGALSRYFGRFTGIP